MPSRNMLPINVLYRYLKDRHAYISSGGLRLACQCIYKKVKYTFKVVKLYQLWVANNEKLLTLNYCCL